VESTAAAIQREKWLMFWDDSNDARLAELYGAGIRVELIAGDLRTGEKNIKRRVRDLGLKRHRYSSRKDSLTKRQRRMVAKRYVQLIKEGSIADGSFSFLARAYGIKRNDLRMVAEEFYPKEQLDNLMKIARRYLQRR
jgi:hypothetical protein